MATTQQTAEDFVGNERFLVQRRLGAGAFGVVYEAFDRLENAHVALKVLRFSEADALYRFKKGFRSLADIRHPNLVSFYELFTEGGLWFFSMEMVPGVDFIEYLTGVPSDVISSTLPLISSRPELAGLAEGGEGEVPDTRAGATDYDRIRRTVLGLARGLEALHRSGKVHRDIKPPNVLVTAEGRVILLDFGLVAELAGAHTQQAVAPQLVGTPAYMSPEQALAVPGSPACDWYSVGVMLYQAVSGDLPFQGSLVEIFTQKQTAPPPNLRDVVPGVPEDLDALCRGLLDPDPDDRLGGEAVIRRLEEALPPSLETRSVLPAPDTAFVGRREHLDHLMADFETSYRQAVVTYVRGVSGMGKTALLHHFAEAVMARDDDAVVLMGRCYLQESVPYKAIDSLVDALSRFLTGLSEREVELLLPTRIRSLTRLFPVLLRVEPIAVAEGRSDGVEDQGDPKTIRRRGFEALRELLTRLASRRRVVLIVDDLQWGDIDSFFVLDELFRDDPPPVHMVTAHRSEDAAGSQLLRALEEQRAHDGWPRVEQRELEVGPLGGGEARELLRALERVEEAPLVDELAASLDDAGGNPLLLTELARYSRSARMEGSGTPMDGVSAGMRLHDLILGRIETLPPAAQRLLRVVAVAGKPVDLEAARKAAELESGAAEALAQLRSRRLIRQTADGEHVEIEAYHDRIRETVTRHLSGEESRRVHRQLALALESVGRAEPETLAVHFQATEEMERARRYVISAAERAESALAFERAARLYRLALDLLAVDSSERYELRVKLASALGNSGHSRAAADTYIEAVGDSGSVDPLEVQRQAAEKLLISGHIDRGLAVLRHVLRTLGMGLERQGWRRMLNLRWLRLRLRFQGYAFEARDEALCDPELLQRIDVCWSVEIGLFLVDVLHASEFHARHLLLALEAGEPQRVARGLAMEVFFVAMEGGDADAVLDRARDLASGLEGSYASALVEMTAGMLACSRGHWQQADRRLVRSEELLRETRHGVVWELDTVQHFRLLAQIHLGVWPQLFGDLPRHLERAVEQGDLYLEIHLLQWVESLRLLTLDRPDEAQRLLDETLLRWSYEGFHFQHFGHLYASVQVALYQGRVHEAHRLVNKSWRALDRSMIQRIAMVRVQSHNLRARTALAAAEKSSGSRRQRLLGRVRADARTIERSGSGWALALASSLRAGAASVEGHDTEAREHLEVAIAAFDASGMVVNGILARRCRACLDGGTVRDAEAADRTLAELGVVDPRRLAAVAIPGRWPDLASDFDPGMR